jgi:hypothetical protein
MTSFWCSRRKLPRRRRRPPSPRRACALAAGGVITAPRARAELPRRSRVGGYGPHDRPSALSSSAGPLRNGAFRMTRPIIVGAVLYDPKGLRHWEDHPWLLRMNQCPVDVVFYTNYELQVDGLIRGHIDIAWNSPLAWVDTVRRTGGRCRAIAMRDTRSGPRLPHHPARPGRSRFARETLRGQDSGRTAPQGFSAGDSHPWDACSGTGSSGEGLPSYRRFDLHVGKARRSLSVRNGGVPVPARGEAAASTLLDLNAALDPGRHRIRPRQ